MSIYVSVMNLHSFMQKMFFCCISDTVCWSSVCFLQWLIDRNPGTFLSKSHLLLPLVTTCNFILTVTEAGLSYNRLWINYLHGCDSELPCRRDKGGDWLCLNSNNGREAESPQWTEVENFSDIHHCYSASFSVFLFPSSSSHSTLSAVFLFFCFLIFSLFCHIFLFLIKPSPFIHLPSHFLSVLQLH